VKKWLAALAAAAAGAFVLFRPLPPPAAGPGHGEWSSSSRTASARGAPDHRGRLPAEGTHALVYVAGEVRRPGVYPVGAAARILDALALAGGPRPDADLIAVNLAAHVADGDEIVVPARGSPEAAAAAPGTRASRHVRGGRGTRPRGAPGHPKKRRGHRGGSPPASQVDINSADAETLATIPGIGGGLAARIVAFRAQNGPFASVDELLDVSGITEHRLDALFPYVVAR
jgi:competence protein ComEA